MPDNKFEMHCIVELFGHQQIAGKVTEQSIGGATFIRVDVPKTQQRESFTKFYGPSAIYAITPVEGSIAQAMAESLEIAPVAEWRLKTVDVSHQLPEPSGSDDDPPFFSDDDDDLAWDHAAEAITEEIMEIAQDDDKLEAAKWARDLLAGEFVVLDTETTGLNKERDDEPVQIAVIDQAGTVLLDTLVKPSFPIPADATRIHGITDEMVKDAPAYSEIRDRLVDALRGKPLVIFNLQYDKDILMNVHRNLAGLYAPAAANGHFCAMEMYAQFYGEWNDYHGNYRWQSLVNACSQQGIEVVDEHSALGDCKMTLALIKKMAEYGAPEVKPEAVEPELPF